MKRPILHLPLALQGALGCLYMLPSIWTLPLMRVQEVTLRGGWGVAFLCLFAAEGVLCLAAAALGCAGCRNRLYAYASFAARALFLLLLPVFLFFSYTSLCALLGRV